MNAVSGLLKQRELTIRGIIIGIVITIVFTAANVYFGLKAGLTFSTSIPAAVISMAILKAMRDATIQENNIVQTVASAAGTLSSIIFVLPGLVIIGYWTGFPFWISAGICATGGILGVMYTIPLRRALVTDSDLPYPEGVACAEVLKVGAGEAPATDAKAAVETGGAGLKAVLWGAIVSAIFYVIVQTKVFASDVAQYFRVGVDKGGSTGYDFSLSFALFAIGHLVGLWVGVAMLVGAAIGWVWAVPYFAAHFHTLLAHALPLVGWKPEDVAAFATGDPFKVANQTWKYAVRFIGAGTIGVAAIWTLAKLVKPLVNGLAGAMRASRARKTGTLDTLPRTEHDMPIGMVGLVSLLCLIPIAYLLWHFAVNNGLGGATATLVIGGVVFVVLLSFVVSAVCGYMAGLI
ncbi:MAG: OPT family oligopeptide transporter, partial [Rhodanobacteraceae bacterium]